MSKRSSDRPIPRTSLQTITGLGPVHAAPTRLADGRVAVVQTDGRVADLRGQVLEPNVKLTGETLVSAAASRIHLFVSTTDGFYTLDPVSLGVISKASDILFVFRPPRG